MQEVRAAINWEEVYSQLERTQRTLAAGGKLAPEEVSRILRERAQALARPLEEALAPTKALDLLVFSLAGERYAIETAHVLEVVPLRELTPVPCTPSFVRGVVNYRGLVLPILDFRRLFELAAQGGSEGGQVVAVEAAGMTFGILAEAVVGTIEVAAHEVGPPPLTLSGDHQGFLQGVTGEMVAVLDLLALARDPRMLVKEELS